MQFFQKFFLSSTTKLSTEILDAPSPAGATSTAFCGTPQARRVIKTIDGQQLVLGADDVKYLSVIENMFVNLKASNGDVTPEEEPFVIIPISIDSATMMKIIDWSRESKKRGENHLSFCQFFPEMTVSACFEILEASLFLETPGLGKRAAVWLAAHLEGKSTAEMAEILGVANVGLCSESMEKLFRYNLLSSED